jgi:hypothetical protein
MSTELYEQFIFMSGGVFGRWGVGSTLQQAIDNWKSAGGKNSDSGLRYYRFSSEFPFAPAGRDALQGEADAFVDQTSGDLVWSQCELDPVQALERV